MKSKIGPQLECFRRAKARGWELWVFDNDETTIMFKKGDIEKKVAYNRLNRSWLDQEVPIRDVVYTPKEMRARYLALVAWDHSFVYQTGDQKYDPARAIPSGFYADFPWVTAGPDIFE